jgi:exoribonuclease II
MAVVIPVAIEGMHIASRAGEVAAHKGEAARIAQRILNENVVTTNWSSAQSGTIMEGQRHFRWDLHSDQWNQDPNQSVILQLTAEVHYTIQNRDFSVRMSTLVDSTPPTNGASN